MATRDLAKDAHWRREFAEWKKTGLSGAEYCRQRGIPYHQFKDWQKKLGRFDARATRESSAVNARSKARATSSKEARTRASTAVEFASVNVIDSSAKKTRRRESANPELLTREQAANYLGVTPQLLKKWRCTGQQNLPLVKLGHQVRYKRSDLDAFLQRGYSESKPKQPAISDARQESKEAASVEIVLPNGITLRLNGTSSLHLIAPLVKTLENC